VAEAGPLHLVVLGGDYCVYRLEPSAAVPSPPAGAALFSVTRTGEELSVVAPAGSEPDGTEAEGPFAAMRVAGSLPFTLTGILAGLCGAIAGAGVPVFAISTFDTDYLLVPRHGLEAAAGALETAGHRVEVPGGAAATPGERRA
jgi:hypothetical protein